MVSTGGLGNLAARLPGPGGGAGASDPCWFRTAAGLIEVRLAIRGPVPRRFLQRGQRLVVAPRNFGL